ncbi:unnamed protein product [Darwinula stevensoni]|uniref:UvrD-like helicase C-terminal domain-containing protein n=1 Tax=Darwinula stevensoni TaxID=69355 RepID=A0A7R9A9M0_9CRUS|nr:unnamed protein product [Darwinula stevensoni]CAG0897502.1 unnamed protein product [Darwinula stevensoni]
MTEGGFHFVPLEEDASIPRRERATSIPELLLLGGLNRENLGERLHFVRSLGARILAVRDRLGIRDAFASQIVAFDGSVISMVIEFGLTGGGILSYRSFPGRRATYTIILPCPTSFTCGHINKLACESYNGHKTKDADRPASTRFERGDKVVCRRNNAVGVPEAEAASRCRHEIGRKTVQFTNGSLFKISQKSISKDGQKCYELDDLSGRQFLVNAEEFRRATRLQHGYALGLHAFQVPPVPESLRSLRLRSDRTGSEAENVLCVMAFDEEHQTSQTLYTAVTRAKKNVFFVATPSPSRHDPDGKARLVPAREDVTPSKRGHSGSGRLGRDPDREGNGFLMQASEVAGHANEYLANVFVHDIDQKQKFETVVTGISTWNNSVVLEEVEHFLPTDVRLPENDEEAVLPEMLSGRELVDGLGFEAVTKGCEGEEATPPLHLPPPRDFLLNLDGGVEMFDRQ